MSESEYIILDIDNCIADDLWRYDAIDWDEKDNNKKYTSYHQLCPFDIVKNQHLFLTSRKVLVFTARPFWTKDATLKWLESAGVHVYEIYMRENDNHDCSTVLKKRHLQLAMSTLGIEAKDIYLAYDDREDVVKMYQEQGIRAEVVRINQPHLYKNEKHL